EPYMEEHIDRWQNFDSMGRWNSRVNGMFTYVADRPAYMHQHIQRHFDVGDLKEVRVFTEHTHRGHIKVNSIDLHPKTPGVVLNDGHWAGSYFEKIPVTLEAVAQKGYQFSHWVKHGSSEVQEYPDEKITIFPDQSVTYEARFEVIEDYPDQPEMLYYWVFTDHLPNNTPLYQVDPVHALDPSGRLFYSPAITIDPENTEGIMDRVNDPVDINYHPEFLQGLPFEYSDMRGIRVRNPSLTDTSESNIVFFLPTAGYQPEELTFLARRTSNGQRELVFEYALEEDGAWISGPEEKPTAIMYEEWKSITLPFADIEEASDNPYFRVRIRFGGDEEVRLGSDGNVRFNSISLTGWEKGGIVTPDPPDDPEPLAGCGEKGFTVTITDISGSRSGFWSGEVAEIRVETVLMGTSPCLTEVTLYDGEQLLKTREVVLHPYRRKTSLFYPVLATSGERTFTAELKGQEEKKSWTVHVDMGWVREAFSASGDRYAQGAYGPVYQPNMTWNVPVEEGPVSQPVLQGDNLWFTAGRSLFEVQGTNGTIESTSDFESAIVGNPVLSGDHILVYSDEGVLYAFNDEITWSVDFEAPITEDPLVIGELVLVPVDESRIYGLRVRDGKQVWITELGDGITGKMLYSLDRLYFSSHGGHLYEMQIMDHKIERVKIQKEQEEHTLSRTVVPVIGSKRIYAISQDQKKLLAIGRKTMEVEWSIDLDTPVSDIALGETALFVAYEDGTIESREQKEGSFLWSKRTEPENGSCSYTFSLLKTSSVLYASYGGFNSGLAALNSEDGSILWWSNDGIFAGHPVVMNGWLYTPGPEEMMAFQAVSSNAEPGIAFEFSVHQNYPNPFNPATMIRYDLAEASLVEVAVYDITGRLVEVLIQEHQSPGKYQYVWDASRYSSGVYLLRVRAGKQYDVRRMTLIR
ncbi:PQQ-binding-like beta-propeller repeat protein, partial [Balneolaceae bacterium ANBcel3]|nr:PQQ-binding-like beta-propeller repeat protein [Balneolaceae bacterium ANBcel3]